MKTLNCLWILGLLLMLSPGANAQGTDAEGCNDHPMFNRMKNFHIGECTLKEFDAFMFPVQNSTAENCKKQSVEGKYYYINYQLDEGVQEPSALQIFRNFENALTQIKATIVAKVVENMNSSSFITGKVTRANMETWIYITATGYDYQVTIVEKQLMEQVIQASEMLTALNNSGFIALNILFDTGKSTIKSESQGIIDQVFDLLKTNPTLKVSIEGHTDNVGTPESNKTLSEARAKAVVDAMVAKGIDKSRLLSKGWGQDKPVADNRTEEGRAKNRRVEIVKL
jgi:OmpA-OmpF porin, OOP family